VRKNLVPPVAVVTQSADIDPNSVWFTDNIVAPIILTSRAAPPERLAALEAAGADIVFTRDREVSIGNAVEELRRRGLRRALCEGGPHLFTSLLVADRIDDLCLTLSPTLVVGPAERICVGSSPFEAPREMHLASVLSSHGSLLLRYIRR
jgi:5-amino-6-(5-phosphoribosylamino)uracil reductase